MIFAAELRTSTSSRTAPRTDQPPYPIRRRSARQPAPAVLILQCDWGRQSIVLTCSPSLFPLDEMERRNLARSRGLPRCRDKELHFQPPWPQPVPDESLQSHLQTRIPP